MSLEDPWILCAGGPAVWKAASNGLQDGLLLARWNMAVSEVETYQVDGMSCKAFVARHLKIIRLGQEPSLRTTIAADIRDHHAFRCGNIILK